MDTFPSEAPENVDTLETQATSDVTTPEIVCDIDPDAAESCNATTFCNSVAEEKGASATISDDQNDDIDDDEVFQDASSALTPVVDFAENDPEHIGQCKFNNPLTHASVYPFNVIKNIAKLSLIVQLYLQFISLYICRMR